MSETQPRSGLRRAWDSTAMAVMMAACCLGVMLLVLLIPVIGWGPGLVVLAVGLALMLFIHHRFMGHTAHH